MSSGTKKTSTVTFRIDQAYEQILRADADSKRISLNTLANQIFGHYVEWLRFAEKFGVVVVSKYAFGSILGSLDERAIVEVASRDGENTPRELLLFKLSNLDVDSVLKFIQAHVEYGGYGRYTQSRSEGRNVFSIHHEFGRKGSLFLKSFLTAVISSTLGCPCDCTMTDNSLIITF
jgi:hypothetical protein